MAEGNWNLFGINLPELGILKGPGGSDYLSGTKNASASTQQNFIGGSVQGLSSIAPAYSSPIGPTQQIQSSGATNTRQSSGSKSSTGSTKDASGYSKSAIFKQLGLNANDAKNIYKQYGVSDAKGLLEAYGAKNNQNALNQQYDALQGKYQSQLAGLAPQKDLAISNINQAIEGYKTQAGNQKNKVWGAVEEGINTGLNAAQDVTRQNRNTLRALGILGSSAAGEMLTKPMQQFDKQRASLYQQGQQQVNEIEGAVTQKIGEIANGIKEIELQFSQIAADIQADMRFSEAERAQGLASLQQQFSDRVQQAQLQAQQIQQQGQELMAGVSTSLANIMMEQNPTMDINSIMSQAVQGANKVLGGETAGMFVDPRKEQLGGL